MSIIVIAAYQCEVAGEPTDDIDYQVRYFDSNSIEEIMSRLHNEKPHNYKNVFGEEVRWLFHDTVSVEYDPKLQDGEEIIGFITGKKKTTEPAIPPER